MSAPTLLHFVLDPYSRLIRLMCEEYGFDVELKDVKPWRREEEFLAVNPAAETPVLQAESKFAIVGISAVMMFIEENTKTGLPLLPTNVVERAETRRLLDWALFKFSDDVSRYILEEKFVKNDLKGQTPDTNVLRVARLNRAEHLGYFDYLLSTRKWLAGGELTLADFALAAQISSLDYLSEMPWDDFPEVKEWYQRLKSRPAFRTLLTDRVLGMPASQTYADLDF